ncbi:MAG: glycosyltransferase family 39 protein [Chthoniobacterales bacterium]|nr:glycosyltransferase family 39 protein [Chthoniobacterales bacterium]
MGSPRSGWDPAYCVVLLLTLLLGIFLRLPQTAFQEGGVLHLIEVAHPAPAFTGMGFDEHLYSKYVDSVIREGLTEYPAIVDRYIEVQQGLPGSILPPVRFLYILSAYLWHCLFGSGGLTSLQAVASLFSILTLLVSCAFAWRLKGPLWALGTVALMACAPTQIHMSQHALVDGFFTFWALLCLWLLWENLRTPRRPVLLVLYTLALALLVLTKENSFFVFIAILALLVSNRWLGFGSVTKELVVCTFAGPLFGVVVLIFLAGGIETLLTVYRLSVGKNFTLPFAIATGDGPWHRYLIDLLLVSPIVLLLALGSLFRLARTQTAELYLIVFVVASYAIMCNVRYGMNLRYANMWDMPLRFLAFSQIVTFGELNPKYRMTIVGGLLLFVSAFEIHQYIVLSVQYPLYELVTEGLLRALHILKGSALH